MSATPIQTRDESPLGFQVHSWRLATVEERDGGAVDTR